MSFKKLFCRLNILIIFISVVSCKPVETKKIAQAPNILWIYVEDICPLISSYGVDINQTPAIDKLAKNGVLFSKAFTITPVCSSTRSGIITGTYATTFGLHNHHSSRTVESGIFLPSNVKTIPELFKEAGYYTFNKGKDDYNFIYNRKNLYEGEIKNHYYYTFSGKGSWKDNKEGKPFFGQIQIEGGKHALSTSYKEKYTGIDWINPNLVDLPPYYPENTIVRQDWASHYDAVRITDKEVDQIMTELESDGLLENTVVFFFSDHGYKGIRHKQFCYDGGIHVPLIIADYRKKSALAKNIKRSNLASLLDVGTTSLALAGIPIPDYMEGLDLFDKNYNREYIVATRDRCDFTIDKIRAIRTEKFKYIKNFMPERSYTQPSYRDKRKSYKAMEAIYANGEMNEIQAKYWKPNKPAEELFDLENDPHEINNLAEKSEYKAVLDQMRIYLNEWIEETGDKGQISETATLIGRKNLQFMYERWGEKCVNPEYDMFKKNKGRK